MLLLHFTVETLRISFEIHEINGCEHCENYREKNCLHQAASNLLEYENCDDQCDNAKYIISEIFHFIFYIYTFSYLLVVINHGNHDCHYNFMTVVI